MSNAEIDLARIAATLNRYDVDYVVVGGMAVVLHGGESTTLDVDLAFDRSSCNIERLASALQELSAKPKRWVISDFRLTTADLSSRWLHLESDSGDIDLIAEIPNKSYDLVKSSCELFEIDQVRFQVASIQELIQMKRNTGRGKDAAHVAELEALLQLRADLK